jgi:arylformamidase
MVVSCGCARTVSGATVAFVRASYRPGVDARLLRPGEADRDDGPLKKRRSAATMSEQPTREMPQRNDDGAVAAHREAAEAKQLEARRRFLLGSGAALSALVTMSPERANAVTHSECAAGMDWMTMSLEARNLAFNNVAHVGPNFARRKTEGWAAASKALREQRPEHLDLAYAPRERTKWDLYPATDPKAPCFVHIHGGYWQRGSKEAFACLAEGALAHGWSAALPGYTLAPEAKLTQITDELRTAFDWLDAKAAEHRIEGPVIVTGWSAGGHLTAFMLDHRKVAAGLSISGVFELAPLRDSAHVNDKVNLTEFEIETLSPMRRPGVNKPLSIAYGTGELPAMIASSRDYHAYRARAHLPGDLIPVANANHFTILDELRQANSVLTRAVLHMAEYRVP